MAADLRKNKDIESTVVSLKEYVDSENLRRSQLALLKQKKKEVRKDFLENMKTELQKIDDSIMGIKEETERFKPLLDALNYKTSVYNPRKNYMNKDNVGKSTIIDHNGPHKISYCEEGWFIDDNFVENMHNLINYLGIKYYSKIVKQLIIAGFQF